MEYKLDTSINCYIFRPVLIEISAKNLRTDYYGIWSKTGGEFVNLRKIKNTFFLLSFFREEKTYVIVVRSARQPAADKHVDLTYRLCAYSIKISKWFKAVL